MLFTCLHLASGPQRTRELLAGGATWITCGTVTCRQLTDALGRDAIDALDALRA